MTAPADPRKLADTVREALRKIPWESGITARGCWSARSQLEKDACDALDALVTLAEAKESDLEHQSDRRAYWRARAESAEDETARWKAMCGFRRERQKAAERERDEYEESARDKGIGLQGAWDERDRLARELAASENRKRGWVKMDLRHQDELARARSRVEELERARDQAAAVADSLHETLDKSLRNSRGLEARVEELAEALANGVEIAGYYMDNNGRGDLDGWADSARTVLAASTGPEGETE